MNHPTLLTIDLEDWFQLIGRRFDVAPDREQRQRLAGQVDRILQLLRESGAQATFFVLGITAQDFPAVIERVAAAGHEVASHGHAHGLVHRLTPQEFAADLQRSIDILTKITGKRPIGYRAPEFSIDAQSTWAFDVLLDAGFTYDSSVFPFRGPRYGIPTAAMGPGPIATPAGRTIMEFPLAVYDLHRQRVPIAGGGYWRALPGGMLRGLMRDVASSRPLVLYFHPAEFDPELLWMPSSGWRMSLMMLRQNAGRRAIPGKLQAALAQHSCVSIAEYVASGARSMPSVAVPAA